MHKVYNTPCFCFVLPYFVLLDQSVDRSTNRFVNVDSDIIDMLVKEVLPKHSIVIFSALFTLWKIS